MGDVTPDAEVRAHTYPAFADNDHLMDDFDTMVEDLLKRKADTDLPNPSKRMRTDDDVDETGEDEAMDEADNLGDNGGAPIQVELKKAKPPSRTTLPWGSPDDLPNTSGFFFPYVPELCSYDTTTVPSLIDDYLVQSLGDKPERQMERLDKIRSAWGLIGKTDSGNVLAHLCKVISLSLRGQGRAFPIVLDGIYQGCVLSGARMFVGIHGVVHRPLPFEKLQDETGSYHMHSIVLDKIVEIADEDELRETRPVTMRGLRKALLACTLTEEDRDEIRKLAVHLHFRGDKFLAMNPQTIMSVIRDITSLEVAENDDLPLHHSALFSRDKVLVALSAFGYQAPSFMIENCPKVALSSPKPPQTLVFRQKPIQTSVIDWKNMLENQEIRNNPRNLSRANRDRSIVGNDKTVLWGEMMKMAKESGGHEKDTSGIQNEQAEQDGDGMDDW